MLALQFEASFTDHSHTGCVKTVTVSRKGVLASGSTDETIRLFRLKNHTELGSLIQHSGSVTGLEFHGASHMFSCSEDGTLCLWKAFTWECLKTFKGHKSGINSLSIHPSGKLALTVGKDKTLHTWNLITGRSAYTTNLKQVGDLVRWCPAGDLYLMVYNNVINVYSVETAEIINTIENPGRVNCVDFVNEDIVAYGGEGGAVSFHHLKEKKALHELNTGTNRIKGLCITKSTRDPGVPWMVTASSDGTIQLYEISLTKDVVCKKLAEHDTSFRLTCLAVYNQCESKDKDTNTDGIHQRQKVKGQGDNCDTHKKQKRKSEHTEQTQQSVQKELERKQGKRKLKDDSSQVGKKKLKIESSAKTKDSGGKKRKRKRKNKADAQMSKTQGASSTKKKKKKSKQKSI